MDRRRRGRLPYRNCGTWLAPPNPDPDEQTAAAELVWRQALSEPPARRLRRVRPLAERGIELAPNRYGRLGELTVYKDGFRIGYLYHHGGRWDADACYPPDGPRVNAAIRERHRDDALDALIGTVKKHAHLTAADIAGYRERGMDLYADLLARRLAAHRPTRNPNPQEPS